MKNVITNNKYGYFTPLASFKEPTSFFDDSEKNALNNSLILIFLNNYGDFSILFSVFWCQGGTCSDIYLLKEILLSVSTELFEKIGDFEKLFIGSPWLYSLNVSSLVVEG